MFSSTDRQRDRDFSRGSDSENDNRQPLKCQFPREIGRSQAPRRQQGNPGFTAGRGFNPAGGAPGGG
ncbi:hypothetical protein F511_10174 [Dorcoceras hygrometricum]|uniref:Uncharacterized protein n=1 Tax=Dorcoceras hygrometricum TaxID=472368 RepID=A0A2Z7B8Z7_9LAMI|nr:hypothetical protein F511_10174 [Dorcoceras hygrometricum]